MAIKSFIIMAPGGRNWQLIILVGVQVVDSDLRADDPLASS